MAFSEGLLSDGTQDSESWDRALLSPMKQRLVDCIMKEFWIIFNQEWCANIQKCSGGSPKSTSSSISQSQGGTSSTPKQSRKKATAR